MSEPRGALILIVEDEPELAHIFRGFFERDGFRVVIAACGVTAVDRHRQLAPDLVVLDVRLPRQDGFEVLARIRQTANTPVIMSTALGEDLEKLMALKSGADDYLVKPFNPLELVARAKAVLRRCDPTRRNNSVIRVGPIEIDPVAHEVRMIRDGAPPAVIDLTRTEFRILAHLASSSRRAFTRGEIIEACLPSDRDALDRTVDSHVSNLRSKLVEAGADGMVQGVRGVGYRLAAL